MQDSTASAASLTLIDAGFSSLSPLSLGISLFFGWNFEWQKYKFVLNKSKEFKSIKISYRQWAYYKDTSFNTLNNILRGMSHLISIFKM